MRADAETVARLARLAMHDSPLHDSPLHLGEIERSTSLTKGESLHLGKIACLLELDDLHRSSVLGGQSVGRAVALALMGTLAGPGLERGNLWQNTCLPVGLVAVKVEPAHVARRLSPRKRPEWPLLEPPSTLPDRKATGCGDVALARDTRNHLASNLSPRFQTPLYFWVLPSAEKPASELACSNWITCSSPCASLVSQGFGCSSVVCACLVGREPRQVLKGRPVLLRRVVGCGGRRKGLGRPANITTASCGGGGGGGGGSGQRGLVVLEGDQVVGASSLLRQIETGTLAFASRASAERPCLRHTDTCSRRCWVRGNGINPSSSWHRSAQP